MAAFFAAMAILPLDLASAVGGAIARLIGPRLAATRRALRNLDLALPHLSDAKRQGIVDSWPEDLDDSSARAEWGWKPAYEWDRAFDEYLVPSVRARYKG